VTELNPQARPGMCRCKRPKIAMKRPVVGVLTLCGWCDMGRPDAGPPVLMDYIKTGAKE
jgi:hypothetical protein